MELDGFQIERHNTCIESDDLDGKQLWLFRLPKDVSIDQLNGQKLTIPSEEAAEIATIETDSSELTIRKTHDTEKEAFHVLLSGNNEPYKLGPRFEGLISVQQLPKAGTAANIVDRIVPYEHIPQQKNLTVRFMPIGSTSDMQELQSTIAERTPLQTVTSPTKKKKKTKAKHQAEQPEPVLATPSKLRKADREVNTTSKEKKKHKRKSTEPEKEQSTKKKKKNKSLDN